MSRGSLIRLRWHRQAAGKGRLRRIAAVAGLAALALLAGLVQPAFAADGQARAAAKVARCSDGTMTAMSQCLERERQESDARLNLVYGKLNQALAEPLRLRDAQRAWIAFRDLECRFRRVNVGGTLQGFSANSCLVDLTEKRIAELEAVQPEEGGIAFKPAYAGKGSYCLPPRAGAPSTPH